MYQKNMGKLDTKQRAGQAHEYELEPNIDTEEEKEGLKASLHFLIILQIALLYNHTTTANELHSIKSMICRS
jgi:hypothetical protein